MLGEEFVDGALFGVRVAGEFAREARGEDAGREGGGDDDGADAEGGRGGDALGGFFEGESEVLLVNWIPRYVGSHA